MSTKSWKDALLSSGQPLEYSAGEVLAKFKLSPPREFSYLRNNENGLQTEFSIDLHSSQIGIPRDCDYWIDYLIECKYRRDGTNWIFTPETHERVLGPKLKDVFVILDQLSDDTHFSRNYFETFSESYRFCTRGCEVMEHEQNTVSIDRAISQLQYAVPNLIAESLEHQVDRLLGNTNPAFLIVPILVTTADLWCLRRGMTIEQIRGAKDLRDVADALDILVLSAPPDNLLQAYSKLTLETQLGSLQKSKVDISLQGHSPANFQGYRDVLARYSPSGFIIVHLKRFEECIRRLTSFFEGPKTFEKKIK